MKVDYHQKCEIVMANKSKKRRNKEKKWGQGKPKYEREAEFLEAQEGPLSSDVFHEKVKVLSRHLNALQEMRDNDRVSRLKYRDHLKPIILVGRELMLDERFAECRPKSLDRKLVVDEFKEAMLFTFGHLKGKYEQHAVKCDQAIAIGDQSKKGKKKAFKPYDDISRKARQMVALIDTMEEAKFKDAAQFVRTAIETLKKSGSDERIFQYYGSKLREAWNGPAQTELLDRKSFRKRPVRMSQLALAGLAAQRTGNRNQTREVG